MKTSPHHTHSLRLEDHRSYEIHRKQMWTQILLPVLLAVLIFIAVIVMTCIATFRSNGDVARWAAISTIWLVIPVLLAGWIVLILLLGTIYLLARLISVIPPYAYQAQQFVYQVENYIKRGTEMVTRPARLMDIIKSQIKKFVGRK